MKKLSIFVICFFVFLNSCSKSYDKEMARDTQFSADFATSEVSNSESDINELDSDASSEVPFIEQKLIKNAMLKFKTDDIKVTSEKINLIVNQNKGYIANESTQDYNGRVNVSMTVRIPAKSFDQLIEGISESVKHFDKKEITTDDVTTQFVDMDARLRVKKQAEERYLQILKQAKDVKDILEIENQIQILRSDIESLEGQLRYLNNKIGFSTIQINYYCYDEATTKTGFLNDIAYAFRKGASGFYTFVMNIISIWPMILIVVAGIFIVRHILRLKK